MVATPYSLHWHELLPPFLCYLQLYGFLSQIMILIRPAWPDHPSIYLSVYLGVSLSLTSHNPPLVGFLSHFLYGEELPSFMILDLGPTPFGRLRVCVCFCLCAEFADNWRASGGSEGCGGHAPKEGGDGPAVWCLYCFARFVLYIKFVNS